MRPCRVYIASTPRRAHAGYCVRVDRALPGVQTRYVIIIMHLCYIWLQQIAASGPPSVAVSGSGALAALRGLKTAYGVLTVSCAPASHQPSVD